VLGERACRATRLVRTQAATSAQGSSGLGMKMDLTSGVRMSVRYMRRRGRKGKLPFYACILDHMVGLTEQGKT
jgi:hypothetical protein